MNALHLRLPATSANLGPGFDALGLALDLWLDIEAVAAGQFTIHATGRNPDQVGSLERNLTLDTYRSLAPHAPALALRIHNEIPLGMGCGSSAAALVAGVQLANHFGALGLDEQQVLDEACRREGHPDNVAACLLGGLTASASVEGSIVATSFGETLPWRLFLLLPGDSVPTTVARNCLPDTYSRADAVHNLQSTALLVAAFALDRPALLQAGARDRLHQPYRRTIFPFFDAIARIPGNALSAGGVYMSVLSGAGPAVLCVAGPEADGDAVHALFLKQTGTQPFEFLATRISAGAILTIR